MQHPHAPIPLGLNPSASEITNIKNNVRWAFDDFLARWKNVISQNAYRFRTSRNDQNDFCQVGGLALYNAVQTYVAGNTSFATFATTLIQNAMRDEQRKSLRRTEVTCTLAKDADLRDVEVIEYPDHLVQIEESEMVTEWRGALDQREERIIKMVFDKAMTMSAVGRSLGLSTARISQIMKAMRKSARKVA